MGFSLKKAFHTDKRAESEGRKLVLIPDADPKKASWLLIARKGNTAYKEHLSKVLQENKALLDTKTKEAEALATRIFKEAAARFLLIGWQNIEPKDDGVAVDYSPEVALEAMQDDDFYKLVDEYASEMSNYRAEEVAKDAKNSATS